MAILTAFFDESGKFKDNPVVSFCGVCTPQPRVAQFDEEWRGLLRQQGLEALHMADALRSSKRLSSRIPSQSPEERTEVLKPFSDCINKYFELGISQAWDVKGHKKIRRELSGPDNPYFIAFVRGFAEIVQYAGDEDRISLICDDDTETAWICHEHYRKLRQIDAKYRKKVISLTFADDRYFPALQAADMLSMLMRLEARRKFYGIKYAFGPLLSHLIREDMPRETDWRAMFADEDKLSEVADILRKGKKRNGNQKRA